MGKQGRKPLDKRAGIVFITDSGYIEDVYNNGVSFNVFKTRANGKHEFYKATYDLRTALAFLMDVEHKLKRHDDRSSI